MLFSNSQVRRQKWAGEGRPTGGGGWGGGVQQTVTNGPRARCEIHRCRSGWGVGGVGEREGDRERGKGRGKERGGGLSMPYDCSNSWAHLW